MFQNHFLVPAQKQFSMEHGIIVLHEKALNTCMGYLEVAKVLGKF